MTEDEYRVLKLARAYSDTSLPELFRSLCLRIVDDHQSRLLDGNGHHPRGNGRRKAGSAR